MIVARLEGPRFFVRLHCDDDPTRGQIPIAARCECKVCGELGAKVGSVEELYREMEAHARACAGTVR